MSPSYFSRIETIDRLIRLRGTGTPEKLARRLNISERHLYSYISFMKDMGAPIAYSKQRESYYYLQHGGFNFKFQNLALSE